jgi:large subunit ribosomal protein L30
MKKFRIKQVKSGIGKPLRQKRTIEALGIRKMYQEVEVVDSPQVQGMIAKVRHLIEVEEI